MKSISKANPLPHLYMLDTSSCSRLLTSSFKKSFRNKIKMSNCLDPDHSVGSDLDPNCLQIIPADDKSCCWQGMKSHPGLLAKVYPCPPEKSTYYRDLISRYFLTLSCCKLTGPIYTGPQKPRLLETCPSY